MAEKKGAGYIIADIFECIVSTSLQPRTSHAYGVRTPALRINLNQWIALKSQFKLQHRSAYSQRLSRVLAGPQAAQAILTQEFVVHLD